MPEGFDDLTVEQLLELAASVRDKRSQLRENLKTIERIIQLRREEAAAVDQLSGLSVEEKDALLDILNGGR